ncbi:MAG: FAD/NAD(P)-binding protein [Oligoflexia bacterium]|nr:FAD/NAD(P)-binding protein [Oligoflexia bacterium]
MNSTSTDKTELKNIYRPMLMKIISIADETKDTRTLRLEFSDQKEKDAFNFKAGQFGLYSAFGHGEAVFCISSSPSKKGYIECTFKKVGKVTVALRNLDIGDTVGFRGPYGNNFPIDNLKGKNLLFIGGGIGLAPLRSLIDNVLDLRSEFSNITILCGARSVSDFIYKGQIREWESRSDLKLVKTVDALTSPAEETEWKASNGRVGLIPKILADINPSANNTYAIVCGPPIMIKFTLQELEKLNFSRDKVITTLENRMKCGFGKCGRCNIGPIYICKEGPVFTAEELKNLPQSDF